MMAHIKVFTGISATVQRVVAAVALLGATSVVASAPRSAMAQQRMTSLARADLAVVLPANPARDETLFASASVAPLPKLFDRAWYDAALRAFESTPVGSSPSLENGFDDWRLVSFRIVPCASLANGHGVNADEFCWPEVRLVWQPVVEGNIIPRFTPHYADDRAFHTLYDVPADTLSNPRDAARASALLAKVKTGLATGPAGAAGLSEGEKAEFIRLRNAVSSAFLSDALALRGREDASRFDAIAIRPEYDNAASARAFRGRMVSFLAKYAPAQRLRDLTAFSLPEGRDPPMADEWIFLAFEGRGGQVRQKDITLHSAKDGRVLFNYGKDLTGTMQRDDAKLYDALDAGTIPARDRAEIEASVFLIAKPGSEVIRAVTDRSRLLVPNTSCASCHKMNDDLFQFHNLSYLEDRDVSVSPRVTRDVELDLAWVRSNL